MPFIGGAEATLAVVVARGLTPTVPAAAAPAPGRDDEEERRAQERQTLIVALMRELAVAYEVPPGELSAQWAALRERRILDETALQATLGAIAVAPRSRYVRDFEDLGPLGKGAQGSVRRARHRVDKAVYAVKRVRVRRAAEKDEREMKILAKLAHPGVVRYFGAWIEDHYHQAARVFVPPQRPFLALASGAADDETALSLGASLLEGDASSANNNSSSSNNNNTNNINSSVDSSAAPPPRASDIVLAAPPPSHVDLFLQMELCGERTLRDWIDARNNKKKTIVGSDHLRRRRAAIRCLADLASALAYIHSHGVIHRDLKPENLLLRERGFAVVDGADAEGDSDVMPPVVIADFGLSKTSLLSHVDMNNTTRTMEGSPLVRRAHTSGVGTPSYAAPEQLHRTASRQGYDASVDIFPLGLVAYELLTPLPTAMERARTFDQLRNHSTHHRKTSNPALASLRDSGDPIDADLADLVEAACGRTDRPTARDLEARSRDLSTRCEAQARAAPRAAVVVDDDDDDTGDDGGPPAPSSSVHVSPPGEDDEPGLDDLLAQPKDALVREILRLRGELRRRDSAKRMNDPPATPTKQVISR